MVIVAIANFNILFLLDIVLIPQFEAHQLQTSKLSSPKMMTISRD
jgi:hypothetical protein